MKLHNVAIMLCLAGLCYIGISRVAQPKVIGFEIQPVNGEIAHSYVTRAERIILEKLDFKPKNREIAEEKIEILRDLKKLVYHYALNQLGVVSKLPVDRVTEIHQRAVKLKERN